MSIENYPADKMVNLEANYRRLEKTEGGTYSLFEIETEKVRRRQSAHDGRDITSRLLRLAKESADGLVSFKELWDETYVGVTWSGQGCYSEIRKSIDAAAEYCLKNELPYVTALLVNDSTREHPNDGKTNMHETAIRYGRTVPDDVERFIAQEIVKSQNIEISELPD